MPARAKFLVPEDLAPGVNRAKYGLFKVGDTFEWPLNAKVGDNPSLKLVPMNEEATGLLLKTAKLKIKDKTNRANKDVAKALLAKIEEVEADSEGVPYHQFIAGVRAEQNATVPPEDKGPPLAPGEVKVDGVGDPQESTRTSDQ